MTPLQQRFLDAIDLSSLGISEPQKRKVVSDCEKIADEFAKADRDLIIKEVNKLFNGLQEDGHTVFHLRTLQEWVISNIQDAGK